MALVALRMEGKYYWHLSDHLNIQIIIPTTLFMALVALSMEGT
jgi:hypothetical protein